MAAGRAAGPRVRVRRLRSVSSAAGYFRTLTASREVVAGGRIAVYDRRLAVLRDVEVDFNRCSGKRGGEPLDAARGQSEEDERYRFRRGFLTLRGTGTPPIPRLAQPWLDAILSTLTAGGRRRSAAETDDKPGWLTLVAAGIVLVGVTGVAVGFATSGTVLNPNRFLVFHGIVAGVFGLMLVELLFRSMSDDARWQVRPLCIGLAAIFAFDIYLYGDALLFGRVDVDVWSARGLVCLLAMPLAAVSIARMTKEALRLTVSRRIVFRSTALIASYRPRPSATKRSISCSSTWTISLTVIATSVEEVPSASSDSCSGGRLGVITER